ncbi:MAG: tetratricopeptide repeat protein, partial [Muribaculum sp.]|nr:tetratricopeptide repeat protein [Muribaculum sp.]
GMDPTPVIANYDKALSLAPDHVGALMGKGRTYFDAGAYDEALACFDRAAEVASAHVAADVDSASGDGQERALCGGTDYPQVLSDALFMAGQACHRTDDFAGALDRYLRAEAGNNGKNPELHDRMADLYESVGDDTSASTHRAIARKLRTASRRRKK